MNAKTLIRDCRNLGVSIYLDAGAIKLRGAPDLVKSVQTKLRPHKSELQEYLSKSPAENNVMQFNLALFRFDLMAAEIEAGYPPELLTRLNNMAWELMQADGMSFNDAIRIAAEIVVSCKVAACEATYEDVQALFERVCHDT